MSVELKMFKKEIYLKGILFAQYIANEHEAELKQKRLYVTESLIKKYCFQSILLGSEINLSMTLKVPGYFIVSHHRHWCPCVSLSKGITIHSPNQLHQPCSCINGQPQSCMQFIFQFAEQLSKTALKYSPISPV